MGDVVEVAFERPLEDQAVELLEFLNAKARGATGKPKRFPVRRADGSLSHSARMALRLLRDGYEFDDIRSVVAMKCREWNGTRWAKYLRPKTLFGPENFEGYFGELQ